MRLPVDVPSGPVEDEQAVRRNETSTRKVLEALQPSTSVQKIEQPVRRVST
jgi:hypothetical protein